MHLHHKRKLLLLNRQHMQQTLPAAKVGMQQKVLSFFRQLVIATKRIATKGYNEFIGKQQRKVFRLQALAATKDHFRKMKIGLDRLIVNANQKMQQAGIDCRFFHERGVQQRAQFITGKIVPATLIKAGKEG